MTISGLAAVVMCHQRERGERKEAVTALSTGWSSLQTGKRVSDANRGATAAQAPSETSWGLRDPTKSLKKRDHLRIINFCRRYGYQARISELAWEPF